MQRRQQRSRTQSVVQRQITAGEDQHVTDLMLQFVQTSLEATGEALLLLFAQATLLEVTGI